MEANSQRRVYFGKALWRVLDADVEEGVPPSRFATRPPWPFAAHTVFSLLPSLLTQLPTSGIVIPCHSPASVKLCQKSS